MVGVNAAKALLAAMYFSHGIPNAGYDVGNGKFLSRLAKLRQNYPELCRGTTD